MKVYDKNDEIFRDNFKCLLIKEIMMQKKKIEGPVAINPRYHFKLCKLFWLVVELNQFKV